jgi:hypothetical protein
LVGLRIVVITNTHERSMTASEKVHLLRSSCHLPLDKLGAGLFPVSVSHVMVNLSNYAGLASGAFYKAAPEQ